MTTTVLTTDRIVLNGTARTREEAIAEALRDGAVTPRELVDKLYSQTHPWLRQAAERNVTAHLLKLQAEGRAEPSGKGWIFAERHGAG